MLLELFRFVTLIFIYAYFFSVFFLHFDMSLLLLTVSCGGYLISIALILSLFSLFFVSLEDGLFRLK